MDDSKLVKLQRPNKAFVHFVFPTHN